MVMNPLPIYKIIKANKMLGRTHEVCVLTLTGTKRVVYKIIGSSKDYFLLKASKIKGVEFSETTLG
jgi:predicted nucleic acid-binding Zn finger protein